MAAARVFDLPELLEAILIHLPMRQLFLVKTVARSWNAATQSSLKLKRLMFLAPDGDVMPSIPEDPKQSLPRFKGVWLFPMMDARHFEPISLLASLDELRHDPKSMVWNHRAIPVRDSLYGERMGEFSAHSFLLRVDRNYGLVLPLICRSMYLCQPPVAAVLLTINHCAYCDDTPTEGVNAVLYNEGGITLGLLVDTFDRMMRNMRGFEWSTPVETVEMGVDFLMKYADINAERLEQDIKQMKSMEMAKVTYGHEHDPREVRKKRERGRSGGTVGRWFYY